MNLTEYEVIVIVSVLIITATIASIIAFCWNFRNKEAKSKMIESNKHYNDKNKPW